MACATCLGTGASDGEGDGDGDLLGAAVCTAVRAPSSNEGSREITREDVPDCRRELGTEGSWRADVVALGAAAEDSMIVFSRCAGT